MHRGNGHHTNTWVFFSLCLTPALSSIPYIMSPMGACLRVPNSLYGSKQARYRLSLIWLPSREFSARIPPTKHLFIKETKSLELETELACLPVPEDQTKKSNYSQRIELFLTWDLETSNCCERACHLQISVCQCSRLWKETGKFPYKEPQVQTLDIGQSY